MKKLIILLIGIIFLGCVQQQTPKLELSPISYSPQEVYAGEPIEATIKINASLDVKELLVEVYVNDSLIESKTISLQNGIETSVNFEILAQNYGENTLKMKVDPGNVVLGSDVEKQKSISLMVKPAIEPDVFSKIPNQNLTSVGLFKINEKGVGVLYGASQIPNLGNAYIQLFSKIYSKNLKELKIGYFAYEGGAQGVVAFIKGIPAKNGVEIAKNIFNFGGEPTVEKKIINGKEVFVLTVKQSQAGGEFGSVCIWDEGGWLGSLVYLQQLETKQICSDILVTTYNSSGANELLGKASGIKENIIVNRTLLGEGYRFSSGNNPVSEYLTSYFDDDGVYLIYIDKTPYIEKEHICNDQIIKIKDKCACEISLSEDTILVQRKVGDYEISYFVVPNNKTSARQALNDSINNIVSLNFPGDERDWVYTGSLKKEGCSLPLNLSCVAYSPSHALLQVKLTNLMGSNIRVNGVRCTNEKLNTTTVILPDQVVTIPQNSTGTFEMKCYDAFGNARIDDFVYLDSKLYVNLTNLSNNSTILIEGNVTINGT
jgi:hypothetical protein